MKILILICIAVGGYFVGKNHNKIKQIFGSVQSKKSNIDNQDNSTLTETPAPNIRQYDNSAKEELIKKCESFADIYEALYEVSIGASLKPNEVISDWNTRISYLDSCPNIQKFWYLLFADFEKQSPEQQKKSAHSFLVFIFSAGIKRDNRVQLIVDETTRNKYYTLKGDDFVNGMEMKIMLPCWHIGNKILVKGIITF